MGGSTTSQEAQLVVDNDAQTCEGCNFRLGDANTASAPSHCARSGQCGGAEGQHSDLLQVISNSGVHCDGVDLFTTLTQQVFGLHHVANAQIVGFGGSSASH